DTAVAGKLEGTAASYADCGNALWKYRQGRYAEARDWARKSLRSLRPEIRAASCFVLAMSEFHLGEISSARSACTEGMSLTEATLPSPGSRDLGAGWKDAIHADVGPEWKGVVF